MERAYLFSLIIILIHLAYLGIFFGIVFIDETYLQKLSIFVQFGVCLFLIYRFSPFTEHFVITRLDRSIIFYCANFLLLNVVIIEAYNTFMTPTAKITKSIYNPYD
jgi:hypothetical protein